MTRTHNKFLRTYVSGYDLSGAARSVGTVGCKWDSTPDMALTDECKNIVNGIPDIQVDPLNAFLSPAPSGVGIHELLSSGAGLQTYTIAYGALAVPTQGDLIFSLPMEQAQYTAEGVAVNVGWGGPTSTNTLLSLGYCNPFGRLLHANGAEVGVNAAVGIDDNGASSALGGYFSYHLLSSDGTVTLKVQDASANNDGSFGDLSGATSGVITAAVTPKHGVVALAITAAVKRYLRWQILLGTATTATFLIGFNRRVWA